MLALVGLGNPGSRYRLTRHNAGFLVLELLHRELGGSESAWENKFNCRMTRQRIAGEDCLLVLPQNYMNLSGETAAPLLNYFKVPVGDVFVVHDDLDLQPGVVRLRLGGSAGGHKGIQNMIEALGSPGFHRIRIGIGHPRDAAEGREGGEDAVTNWVLSTPKGEEEERFAEAVAKGVQACLVLVEEGLAAAQGKFHRRDEPGEAGPEGAGEE